MSRSSLAGDLTRSLQCADSCIDENKAGLSRISHSSGRRRLLSEPALLFRLRRRAKQPAGQRECALQAKHTLQSINFSSPATGSSNLSFILSKFRRNTFCKTKLDRKLHFQLNLSLLSIAQAELYESVPHTFSSHMQICRC